MKLMTRLILIGSSLVFLCAGGVMLTSCSTPAARSAGNAPLEKDQVQKTAAPGLGGAQLWAQNCAHCHNVRSPDSYSDAQWDVAMLHMRVRANLTAEEHKKILAFLKSAH